MKSYLFILLSALVLASSCNLFPDYGKKIEFGESEVYYKGDGVTEKEAQKLGDYLVENDILDNKKKKSVQLINDGEDYIIRFVFDKKQLTDESRFVLWKFQYNLSQDVFHGKPARIALTDESFKDYEVLNPIAVLKIDKSLMLYDNGEIKKAEAKKLADFFREIKVAGEDKEALIVFQKEDENPIVKLVVTKPEKLDEEVLTVFSYWQELMREQVFAANKKAKLILTSDEFEDQKALPKLTAEQRQVFENQTQETDQTTEQTVDSLTTESTTSGVLRLPNN